MKSNFNWCNLKQLNLLQTFLAFFLPSLFVFWGFRYILPWTVEAGYPKNLMWAIIASIMLLFFVIIGLLLIKEDAKSAGVSIGERLLIKKIGIKQWLISFVIMISGIILSIIASPISELIKEISIFSIPDYMPFWLNPSIDPMSTNMNTLSPNYSLKGNYLFLTIMLFTLLLNIFAEEIYFRAWLLPKMYSLGKWSWIINGFLFALYHTYQLWLFPTIFVVSLATTLSVYLSKSILPAFTIHIIANFLLGIITITVLVLK